MSELVDKLLQGTPQPAGSAPTGGEGGSGSADGKRDRTAEARIAELTQKRREAESLLQSIQAENADLRERFANLEGRLSNLNVQDSPPPSSFQEMSGGQLSEAWNLAFENQNSNAGWQVTQELIRRATEKAVQESLKQGGEHLNRRQKFNEAQQRVLQRFGEEAQKQDSDLTQRAVGYLQTYQREYGKDCFEQFPHLLEAAYTNAWTDLNVQVPNEAARLRQENEQLRRMATMEPGNRYGARLNDESNAALEKGDVSGAIANLSFVKGNVERAAGR